jgi:hypothetical protein
MSPVLEVDMDALTRRIRQLALLIAGHGPSAAIAIVIAELFYKFHSFTLESLAFLATWYLADITLEGPLAAVRARFATRASRGRV